MRRFLLGLMVALGIATIGSEARAQVGGINDPSFAYYALYLPRQAAQAAQTSPESILNQNATVRQQYAQTNRNEMFDPNGSNLDSYDPFGTDFNSKNGRRKRSVASVNARFGVHGGNLNGLGPQGFYNAGVSRYYRDIRTGRGKNGNIASLARGRGFSGGVGGFGGLPGPR